MATGPTGSAFVVGTDAPLSSIVSFKVQIQSMDATDANGKNVSLLTGSPTVDFARYDGLQTLLDLNDVPEGTYNAIGITLGSGTISYLDTSGGGAPVIKTEAAVFTQSQVSVTLNKPLVIVHAGAPAGLRLDFNLAKSIGVDSSGQITGAVTPTFNITTVGKDDAGAHIDEYTAAVVSVDTGTQSFVVQGPHGQQLTVKVDSQTEWDGNSTLTDLKSNSIVQISGKLDSASQTIDADDVDIVSLNGFYASGQVTYVQPATGAATSFDLYVRSVLPGSTGVQLGQIAQVNLTGKETYSIYWMHNRMSQFVFNASALVPGQSISIGGASTGAADASAVTVDRITLRHWGFVGTVVAGSVNSTQGTFQIQVNGFAGVLIPQAITVYMAGGTDFRDGFNSMENLSSGAKVRVVGVLLRNPSTGQTILIARHVDSMEQQD